MKKGFSIQAFENEHTKAAMRYALLVDRLYQQAVDKIAQAAIRVKIDLQKPFSLKDYPAFRHIVEKTIKQLASQLRTVIETGSREQWFFANRKNDAFLESIMNTSRIRKTLLSRMQDPNLEALKAFQGRKVNGMDLSARIWRGAAQFREAMELGIDVGLGAGKSAQQLSRELRGFLKEPDKLFRRVRDKRGVLHLSKAAKLYNPGQGVYRSSYKNAMRLTRSEINMAYRTADDLRWKQMDFITGFEVKLSNNHTLNGKPFTDICDELTGKYPKDFRFVGWHPQCRCYKTPALLPPDEFKSAELDELKAAINGTEYKQYVSRDAVTDLPGNFKEWMAENGEKVDGYRSTPYFIKDNFRYGKIRNGLNFKTG